MRSQTDTLRRPRVVPCNSMTTRLQFFRTSGSCSRKATSDPSISDTRSKSATPVWRKISWSVRAGTSTVDSFGRGSLLRREPTVSAAMVRTVVPQWSVIAAWTTSTRRWLAYRNVLSRSPGSSRGLASTQIRWPPGAISAAIWAVVTPRLLPSSTTVVLFRQNAPDHARLGALVPSPEHLRPYSRREIAAPGVEPESLVAYPLPGKRTDHPSRLIAGHDPRYTKLQRRRGGESLLRHELARSAGHRWQ